MLLNSLGGGTGSGFGETIIDGIISDFGKKQKISASVVPFPSPIIV